MRLYVKLDYRITGVLHANYCPSISGCRGAVIFTRDDGKSTDTLNELDFKELNLRLENLNQDIWIKEIQLAQMMQDNPITEYRPVGLAQNFLANCAQKVRPSKAVHNHFNVDYYSSAFCDQSVLALSGTYNNKASSCDCDPNGSRTTAICEYFGGQCECEENIIGRRCEQCLTGYYGFPKCLPCNCPTGNCNRITGQCLQPKNSFENGTCYGGFYGFHTINGCKKCNCNKSVGVEPDWKATCDKQSGQCRCKNNIEGVRCDRCKAGFYGYPTCKPCDCNINGTTPEICNPQNGKCLCKDNVVSTRCETCNDGTFNLEARNPKGSKIKKII